MNNSQKIFLFAVEDLNFTRTASRIFVSQQCVSDHIRRLEEFYGVSLFIRRPTLQLTPAGEVLYRTLTQINLLENDLSTELKMVSNGEMGTIRFGINSSRATDLFSRFYPSYHKRYPNKIISVTNGETINLLKMLEANELDVVLGVNAEYNTRFEYTYITSDCLYLVFPYSLFENLLSDSLQKEKKYMKDGFPLELIPQILFVLNHETSTNYQTLTSYLNSVQIEPKCVMRTSNYSLQLKMCTECQLGAVLPTHMLPMVLAHNRLLGPNSKNRLCVFPISGMKHTLRVDAIIQNRAKTQKHLSAFVESLNIACKSYQQEVNQFFGLSNNDN